MYADPPNRERAERRLAPFGIPTALVHADPTDDIPQALARALPAYLLGETRSRILERGFATMIALGPSELVARAHELRSKGAWQPLASLIYMGHDDRDVDVQATFLVQAILDEGGSETFCAVWRSTSILGGRSCLDMALRTHLGMTQGDLEERVLAVSSGPR